MFTVQNNELLPGFQFVVILIEEELIYQLTCALNSDYIPAMRNRITLKLKSERNTDKG